MCGEHRRAGLACARVEGSSPHVRGALRESYREQGPPGIIPACAGSTVSTPLAILANWDHPRMCGEHAMGVAAEKITAGIIPACAGSTRRVKLITLGSGDHPRMCGEHVMSVADSTLEPGSSPHVRGALRCGTSLVLWIGIIPACAGSTSLSQGMAA